jgi:tetratricopeptide (TPR) repeat protein
MMKHTPQPIRHSLVASSFLGFLVLSAPVMALPILLSQITSEDYILQPNQPIFRSDVQRVVTDLDWLIRMYPYDPLAFNARGHARANARDYQGAIADFDQSIRMRPNFALAYYNRGLARSNLQDYAGAMADFDQAIRLQPEFANAYYQRGFLWYRQGNQQAALADYDQALRLFPNLRQSPLFQDYGAAARGQTPALPVTPTVPVTPSELPSPQSTQPLMPVMPR